MVVLVLDCSGEEIANGMDHCACSGINFKKKRRRVGCQQCAAGVVSRKQFIFVCVRFFAERSIEFLRVFRYLDILSWKFQLAELQSVQLLNGATTTPRFSRSLQCFGWLRFHESNLHPRYRIP